MNYLITGGAGFIGSHLAKYIREREENAVIVVLDALTYAGNMHNLEGLMGKPGFVFVHGSIADESLVTRVMEDHGIDAILHTAAETHVDRSIHGFATDFIMTNVRGTQVMLEAAKRFKVKKFVHVSTDEVYGTLSLDQKERFTEHSPIQPNSPYSASKASSDLLAKAYFETYQVPVVITRCTNNFGSHQFPEKLIPYWVSLVLKGKKITMYGDGAYVRDWIHVTDHVAAIYTVLHKGKLGEVYNVGVGNERTNREIAEEILNILQKPKDFIRTVPDRLGHDRRYAIDATKLYKELEFAPLYPRARFSDALRETVMWYANNPQYIADIEQRFGTLNPHIPEEPKAHIAIFGAGMLGTLYKEYFVQKGYEVTVITVDVRDVAAVRESLKDKKFDAVLNCVAKTDIDWCERNQQETLAVNTIGADTIGAACQEFGLYLVHISSGCIQESKVATQVWKETDEVSPVCFYAWTKVFADTLLLDRAKRKGLNVLILRPRQLLTAKLSPRNALSKMLTYSKFIDTPNSCTVVEDLLEVTENLIQKKATGIYNVANPGITSPYKIAIMLKEIIKPDMNIAMITKEELNRMTLAERIDSVLSLEKLAGEGIVLPHIDTRLREIMMNLKQSLQSEEAARVMQKVATDTREKLALKEQQPS